MGAERLNVDPAALSGACESLSAAAQHLRGRLHVLDGAASGLLAGWQGASGGAYGQAWTNWHQGAREVESALAVMATLLDAAGRAYASGERQSAAELGGLSGG